MKQQETDTPFWVSMPIIRSIVMSAAAHEKDLKAICAAGGIRVSDLDDTAAKISLETNCAIMAAAATVTGDPCLGLHVGQKITPSILSAAGHLVQSSENMLVAMQHVQEFTATFTRLYHYRIETNETEARYYCEPVPLWNEISPETARQSVDISFSGSIHIAQLLTGKQPRVKKVMYRYKKVADTTEYERILKCKPLFNQECNCIVFQLSDLLRPVHTYNKELHQIFRQLLLTTLRQQEAGELFSNKVRQAILDHSELRFPQLEEIAAALHLTPRTLQRKLRQEQTSFRLLSDKIKQHLASNLLGNKTLSADEIAFKLGYTSTSTFRKAFRLWTGETPGAFRRERQHH